MTKQEKSLKLEQRMSLVEQRNAQDIDLALFRELQGKSVEYTTVPSEAHYCGIVGRVGLNNIEMLQIFNDDNECSDRMVYNRNVIGMIREKSDWAITQEDGTLKPVSYSEFCEHYARR